MSEVQKQNSTEAVDNDKGKDCNWTELPAELLMTIFNELKFNNKDLLNGRIVHPAWKCVIDSLFKKWNLEHWTKWSPQESSDVNPHRFPFLQIKMITCQTAGDSDPACLQKANLGTCPIFLTKSICLESDQRRSQPQENPPIQENVDSFFSKWGHQLTSLTFHNLDFDLPAKALHGILTHTQNLKALEFNNMSIKDFKDISLPPLPHLTHIHLLNVKNASINPGSSVLHNWFNLHKWFLEQYKEQLVSLKIDDGFHWIESDDGVFSYPNLIQLTIVSPSGSLLLSTISCPSLKLFAVTQHYLSPPWTFVLKFLFQVSSALAHFHVETTSFSNFLCAVDEIQLDNPPMFPLLKTLFVNYTAIGQADDRIKNLLKLIPNLEKRKIITNQRDVSK